MTQTDRRPTIETEPQMNAQASRIVRFWAERGIMIRARPEMYGGQWTIRSTLTGMEPCDRIEVQPARRGA